MKIGLALAVGLALWAAAAWLFQSDRHRLAEDLNLKAPPKTLRVLRCKSDAITDVSTTCFIEIDPREFPLLLEGYEFEEVQARGTSRSEVVPSVVHRYGTQSYGIPDHDHVAPLLHISTVFEARPAEFKSGGSVLIFSDRARKQAVVQIYVE